MDEKLILGLKNIAEKFNLKLLILFGSRAKGTEKSNSDYDFAFFPSKIFSVEDEMNLFNSICAFLHDEKVDLLNLRTSNKLYVINNVFQTGKLIYEKNEGFFVAKKWDAWMDLQDFERYSNWQFELTKKSLQRMVKENG